MKVPPELRLPVAHLSSHTSLAMTRGEWRSLCLTQRLSHWGSFSRPRSSEAGCQQTVEATCQITANYLHQTHNGQLRTALCSSDRMLSGKVSQRSFTRKMKSEPCLVSCWDRGTPFLKPKSRHANEQIVSWTNSMNFQVSTSWTSEAARMHVFMCWSMKKVAPEDFSSVWSLILRRTYITWLSQIFQSTTNPKWLQAVNQMWGCKKWITIGGLGHKFVQDISKSSWVHQTSTHCPSKFPYYVSDSQDIQDGGRSFQQI